MRSNHCPEAKHAFVELGKKYSNNPQCQHHLARQISQSETLGPNCLETHLDLFTKNKIYKLYI